MKKRRPQYEKTKISTTQVVKNFRKVSFVFFIYGAQVQLELEKTSGYLIKLEFQVFLTKLEYYAICFIFETNLNLYFNVRL